MDGLSNGSSNVMVLSKSVFMGSESEVMAQKHCSNNWTSFPYRCQHCIMTRINQLNTKINQIRKISAKLIYKFP